MPPVEQSWWDVLVLGYACALVPPGDDPTGWGRPALGTVVGAGAIDDRFGAAVHGPATA